MFSGAGPSAAACARPCGRRLFAPPALWCVPRVPRRRFDPRPTGAGPRCAPAAPAQPSTRRCGLRASALSSPHAPASARAAFVRDVPRGLPPPRSASSFAWRSREDAGASLRTVVLSIVRSRSPVSWIARRASLRGRARFPHARTPPLVSKAPFRRVLPGAPASMFSSQACVDSSCSLLAVESQRVELSLPRLQIAAPFA